MTRIRTKAAWPQCGQTSVLTKWRLKQNRGRSVPLLLSSGIPSVGWDRLVESSWDGVLLHYSWDGDIVRELLKHAEKGKLHPAEKVLKRAYVQESSRGLPPFPTAHFIPAPISRA
jgi:hypothetical protein